MQLKTLDNAKLQEILREYPTPFHLYDEKGIRETARSVNRAFAWNPGFKEYFAVKANPNPYILDILRQDFLCVFPAHSLSPTLMSLLLLR